MYSVYKSEDVIGIIYIYYYARALVVIYLGP